MRSFIFMMVMVSLISCGAGEIYFDVNDITMQLIDGDAIFELNYTLQFFPKLYVLALGCGYIEPDLVSLFKSYDDVKTIKANPDSAVLLAKDAGKNSNGYYLFDSRPLGMRVSKFTVLYPGGLSRTYHNVTSTPNVFFGNQTI